MSDAAKHPRECLFAECGHENLFACSANADAFAAEQTAAIRAQAEFQGQEMNKIIEHERQQTAALTERMEGYRHDWGETTKALEQSMTEAAALQALVAKMSCRCVVEPFYGTRVCRRCALLADAGPHAEQRAALVVARARADEAFLDAIQAIPAGSPSDQGEGSGVALAPPGSRPVETTDECFVVRGEEWRALNELFEYMKRTYGGNGSTESKLVAAVERALQR